ncbi:MAG TPA: dockerin type I domain-containing protein [Planctomycetota bacterium]|nr:dockerin type I domain-containing protein [Planctomycetota bacterium]
MDEHLDLLALDAVRAGEAPPEQRAHVDRCNQCRATVERFRDVVARLAPAAVEVPASVTRTILSLPRSRPVWRRRLAAAAAILIGMAAVWIALDRRPAIRGDVDFSGRVDIVDAYGLAVRLRSGQKLDLTFDVTGDGKVDEQDVEELARRSVAIR